MSGRCCYYLSTYRDPEQVERLLRTMRELSPDALLVLRHDPRTVAIDPVPLRGLGVHLLPIVEPPVRGRFSLILAPLLDTIDWLEREQIDYSWLITLTGQDYPLRPLAAYERDLSASDCDAFLRHWDVLLPESPWSRRKAVRRYWYSYRDLPATSERWWRLLRPLTRAVPGVHLSFDYGPQLGLRTFRVPWKAGFRCYGGWAWGALRREAARFVGDTLRARPELVTFYRNVVNPDESLLPTVLCNGGKRVRQEEQRYIDYARARRGHPRTLTCADLPMLRAGGYTFARKFDPAVDREVLDRIDRELFA